MIFGPGGHVHGTPKPIILNFRPTNLSNKYQEIPNHFKTYYVWKLSDLGDQKCWKRRVPDNPEDPSYIFENLKYGINIFQKAWNGNLVVKHELEIW